MILSLSSATAVILPSDRLASWQGNVGVSGGIPNSSNMVVYTTVAAGASAATINSALSACPSNQVVQLSAGTYNLSADIIFANNGTVLRGAGISNTTVVFSSGGIEAFGAGFYQAVSSGNFNGGAAVNWTAGYDQGTSNLTVSSTAGMSIGNAIVLDAQEGSGNLYVNPVGYEGDNSAGRGGNRAPMQISIITATNATTVTIWPPIQAPFWSTFTSPQVWFIPFSQWFCKVGLENLTVNGSTSGGASGSPYESNIDFQTARDCWVKNVLSISPYAAHVDYFGAINCEVRHCIFYGSQHAGILSYGICPVYTEWTLIEDNTFDSIVGPVVPGTDFSLSVVGYNYSTNNYYTQANNWLMASWQPHDCHSYMLLFEGNFGTQVNSDFIHGSSSHHTIFRNRLTGWEPYTYPSGESANNVFCEAIDLTNRCMSSVGNVLGTSGKITYYESIPSSHHDNSAIYKSGVNSGAGYGPPISNWPDDTHTADTFFRHIDYDSVNAAITYNATNADVTLPLSLYYSASPPCFGIMSWPPYNPTNGAALLAQVSDSATNIPAGYRYYYGVDTPNGAGSSHSYISGGVSLQGKVVLQ